MKLLVFLSAVVIAASTQRILSVTAEPYDDGQYHPDPSEDDGQYHPSSDEDFGEYHDDHLGDYSGQSGENGEPYKHVDSKVEPYKHTPDQLVPYKPFHDGGVYKQSGDTGVYKHVVGKIEPYQHTYVQNSGLNKEVSNNGGYKQVSFQYNQNQLNQRNQGVNGEFYRKEGENDGSYHPDHSGDYKSEKINNGEAYRHVVGKIEPYQHTYVQNSGLYKDVSNNGGYKQVTFQYNQNQGVKEGFYNKEVGNDGSYHPDNSGVYKSENIDNGEAYRHVVSKIEPYQQNPVQSVSSKPFYDRASYEHVSAGVGYNQENNLNNQGKTNFVSTKIGSNVPSQISTTTVNKGNSAHNLNVENVKPVEPVISPKFKFNNGQKLAPTNLQNEDEDDGSYHPPYLGDYTLGKNDNGEAYRHVVGNIETYKQNAVQPVPSKPFYDRASYEHVSAGAGYNQENNLNNQGKLVNHEVNQHANSKLQVPVSFGVGQAGSYGVNKHEIYENKNNALVQNQGRETGKTNFVSTEKGLNVQTQINTTIVNKDNSAQNLNVGNEKPVEPVIAPKYNTGQNLTPTNLQNDDEDDGSYHPPYVGDYTPEKNNNGEAYRHIVENKETYKQNAVQPVPSKPFYDRASYEHVSAGVGYNQENNLNNHGKLVNHEVNQHANSKLQVPVSFGVGQAGSYGVNKHEIYENKNNALVQNQGRETGKTNFDSTEKGLKVQTQISTTTVNKVNSAQNLNVGNVKPVEPVISPKFKFNNGQKLASTNLQNDDEDDGSYHPPYVGDYTPIKNNNGETYRHVVGNIETYKQNAVQPVPSKPFYDSASYEHVSAGVGYNQENNLNNQGKSVNHGVNQHESKLQVPVSFGFGQTESNIVYKHSVHQNKNNALVQNQGRETGKTNFVSTEKGLNVQTQISTTTVNKVNSAQNLNEGNGKPVEPVIAPKYNNGQKLAPTNLQNDGEDDGSYHPPYVGDYTPEKNNNGETYRHVVGNIETYKQNAVQPVPSKPFYDSASYEHVSAGVGINQENNLNNQGKSVNHGVNQHESKLQVPVSFGFGQTESNIVYKHSVHQNKNNALVQNQGRETGKTNFVSTEKGLNVQTQISTTTVNKVNSAQNLNEGNGKPVEPVIAPKYNNGQKLAPTNLQNDGEDDGSYHPPYVGDYTPEKNNNGETYRHVVGNIETYKQNAVQPVPSKPFYDSASYEHVSAGVGYNQENNLNNQGKSVNHKVNQHVSKLQVPVSFGFGQAGSNGVYKHEIYENKNNALIQNQGRETGKTNFHSITTGPHVPTQISTTVNKDNFAQNLNVGNIKPIQPAILPKYNSGQNLTPTNLKTEGEDDGTYHPDHSGDYKHEKVDNGEAYRHVVGIIDPYKQNPVQPVQYKSFNDRVTYEHVSTKVDNKHDNNFNNDGRSVISDVSQHKSVLQGSNLQSQTNAGNRQYQAAYEKPITTSTFTAENMKLIHMKIQSSILNKYNGSKSVFDGYQSTINRKTEEFSPNGYHYVYQNENGIVYEEEGHIVKETQVAQLKIKGFYSFYGLDNNLYTVEYTADSSNGYLLQYGKVIKITTRSKGAQFCIQN